jgi:hypothetical protein
MPRWLRIVVLCVLPVVGEPVWADVESAVILQTSPLAGFQYHAGKALFPLMQVGDHLQLIREPDNAYDPKAVRVEWRGVMIGYAPRADNVDLARLMDRGAQVEGRIVHLQKSRNPWQRVLFEVLVVEGGQ